MVMLQAEKLFLLMLVFSGVFDGTMTATQSVTCHGIVGESVYLQLVPNVVGHQLVLKKITQNGDTGIFRYRRSQILFFKNDFTSSIQHRWHFVAVNGSIIINPATMTDSGTYQAVINSDDTGEIVMNITIQLIIFGSYMAERPNITNMTEVLSKMDTHVALAIRSVVLLSVVVSGGVFYICKRRTHTYKPAETAKLVYAAVSTEKTENARGTEEVGEK